MRPPRAVLLQEGEEVEVTGGKIWYGEEGIADHGPHAGGQMLAGKVEEDHPCGQDRNRDDLPALGDLAFLPGLFPSLWACGLGLFLKRFFRHGFPRNNIDQCRLRRTRVFSFGFSPMVCRNRNPEWRKTETKNRDHFERNSHSVHYESFCEVGSNVISVQLADEVTAGKDLN